MKQYEVTFIVDPVLSGDEIKATANMYEDLLKNEGCTIVHKDEMGLKQLAYPLNKRNSGVYYCIEFKSEEGKIIPKLELSLYRDERILRFLSLRLDKHGIKYNEDKRNGLIGKVKKKEKPKRTSSISDDLTKIEGITSKVAGALANAGVNSFSKLGAADAKSITEVLEKADPDLALLDPSNWIVAAKQMSEKVTFNDVKPSVKESVKKEEE
ncbi:MAG TPA: 30S ribosomal protein S6 [Saprospiraceae bacterium]|nr:30S ribosomal protein S6 [Saprospiraceae bacterium]MCB9329180.1 30S ribosomal protein S6 [Lewinellaceae bacterium]HPK09231.1 30S ribosomal protein S6 [Saprospiraceae bacterium]HPQ21146.1 30S ribosomal protein S6 [Saprospiraceae bacterium]HRX29695.1 30S ribosomal protein S6 [Saprospiraceae bacterium]